jgi:hypothetical protein
MRSRVRVGDTVRIVAIPRNLKDNQELGTGSLFEKCLGKTFRVAGLQTVEELPYQLVQLDVGHIVGKAPSLETIWIEPTCLQWDDPDNITTK